MIDPVSLSPGAGWTTVGRGQYDPTDEDGLTVALAFVLADVAGVDATELDEPLLYDCVDVPAVETAIFGCAPPEQGLEAVSFRYDGYLVTVRRDGAIRVFEPTD